jgi:GH15 family glucan-1,4-alpha-glucosidase
MPRDLPLSNGTLLVAFDLEYRIRDVYFPHVGMENHAVGHPFRVGVWVDGRFDWMDGGWRPELRYADPTLVTDVTAASDALDVALHFTDAVDFYENVLVRRIRVTNRAAAAREIRIFLHHDFHLKETDVGDTALYSPETGALLHYKDDRYFLINCLAGGVAGVQHYACGQKEVGGAEGTWRDAEDGVLSGNPIAQGSVDSTLGVALTVGPGATGEFYCWMAAGRDFHEVKTIDAVVRDKSPAELLRRTGHYWQLWVKREGRDFADLPPEVVERYHQSLVIIRSQIDAAGAVLAANDSDIVRFNRDTYSYAWPRDGALVSVALLRSDHPVGAERFLEFCARIISPEGFVRHKYNPDGTLASSWHGYVREGRTVLPIQEDETALVVWAVGKYFDLYRRVETVAPYYRALVTRPGDFLLGYVDAGTGLPLPSYDLWEERWGVHLFTVAAVIAGLRAAAGLARAFGEAERAGRYEAGADRMLQAMRATMWSEGDGRFVRMVTPGPSGYQLDRTIDASVFGVVEFGVLPPDDPQVESTMRKVEERLRVQTELGGLARYENDPYQQVEKGDTVRVPGNPWFVSTLWLARYHVMRAQSPAELSRGLDLIAWAARHALPSGVMAEQLHPRTGEPLSVSPLTWSHAAYVMAVEEYLDRMRRLTACPTCGQPHARAGARGPVPVAGATG